MTTCKGYRGLAMTWAESRRSYATLLMANEIAFAEDQGTACLSVRDLIVRFLGLKGTAKAKSICGSVGVAGRETLKDFHQQPGAALRLLTAMRASSRQVKPRELGVIGRDHLMERFIDDNCAPESFVYQKREIEHDGLPYMVEAAFGYRPGADEADYGLRVVEGFNFSPAIDGSPFQLEQRLALNRVGEDDPVTVFAHLTAPRLNFLDRGKARISLPDTVEREIMGMVTAVTKIWTKQKTVEIRAREAEPRTVYLTETTQRLVQGLVETTFVGAHAVKGKAEPQKVYRLDSVRHARRDSMRRSGAASASMSAASAKWRSWRVPSPRGAASFA